jgi:hypothetical protein
MSCLLYRLSYIAVADMVTSDAGTHEQQRCRVPVWLRTTAAGANVDQDLGDDERSSRSSKFFWMRPADPFPPTDFYIDACIRELFGTPRSRNSIWSARILRLLRMKASYRFGTYGT